MTWRVDQQTGTAASMLATGYETTWCGTEAEAVALARSLGTPARPAVAWDWEPQTPARAAETAPLSDCAGEVAPGATDEPQGAQIAARGFWPWRDWTEAATQRVLARLREVGA